MFEILGYFKEYYIDNKFIGSIKCDKDRDVIGYSGMIKEIIKEPIILENGKKIKANTSVITILYPLNGKKLEK